jgi:hypothetical protein
MLPLPVVMPIGVGPDGGPGGVEGGVVPFLWVTAYAPPAAPAPRTARITINVFFP